MSKYLSSCILYVNKIKIELILQNEMPLICMTSWNLTQLTKHNINIKDLNTTSLYLLIVIRINIVSSNVSIHESQRDAWV